MFCCFLPIMGPVIGSMIHPPALLGLTQHAGGSADFGHDGRVTVDTTVELRNGRFRRPPKRRSDLMAAGRCISQLGQALASHESQSLIIILM